MTTDLEFIHPVGEQNSTENDPKTTALSIDTFEGKLHIEWDPSAAVTPIGQLPFFILEKSVEIGKNRVKLLQSIE